METTVLTRISFRRSRVPVAEAKKAEQFYRFQDPNLLPANTPAATGHLTNCSWLQP